jgi:asparagine synthase (glutamine-hydrolysing)
MSSADGRYHVSFNGEIYNYLELRKGLEDDGAVFTSTSDTEVLVAAWQHWGPACLSKFVGMFAFAMLDTHDRTLTLARDPFGIKPLFIVPDTGALTFASEIPALLASGRVGRRIDPGALFDYLRWGLVDHSAQSLVAGILRFPAAHYAVVPLDDPGRFHPVAFWDVPADTLDVGAEEATARVRSLFLDSVDLHLRSDVPVGSALSGGIDSSAILCAVRSLAGHRAQLHAFSYVADDPRYDEEHFVDLAAQAAGAVVHKVRLDARDLLDEMDDLIVSQGEPFASTSIFAQRGVFAAARDAGVTVLLDGQGADELFGGYRRYLAGRFVGHLRRGEFIRAGRLAIGVSRLPDVRLDRRVALRALAGALPERLRPWALRAAGREPFPAWLSEAWFRGRGVTGVDSSADGRTLSATLSSAFSQTTLPSLLRYEDRNSMASSRESRVPFLSTPLVEYVFRLPDELLVSSDATSKVVFREAMRGLVPDAILDRRDKIGFNTPEDRWLTSVSGWVDEVIGNPQAARLGGLDVDGCRRELGRLRATGAPDQRAVWRWVNAIRWAELLDVHA